MNNCINDLNSKLASVINSNKFVPLHNPVFQGNEEKYLVDCVRSNFVSSVGEYVTKFESAIEEYTGVKHAIVCVNGTAALHVCLILSGVLKDDEVLMPAMTFIATANAVSYIGARPHFVDVDEKSLGIDSIKLEEYLNDIAEMKDGECFNKQTGKRIKAIVPMHTFGHSVDMDALNAVAKVFNIEVVEDAAESLGSYYKGEHTGRRSKLAAISFNGNKIMTTGGGGAILTDDEELAKLAKHITTTAKIPHKWEFNHDMVGFNYRMPALNAALGLAQIEQMDKFVTQKRALAKRYVEALKNIKEIELFEEAGFCKSNYWLNAIIIKKGHEDLRDEILEKTNSSGIMTRPIWTLLNKLDMFKHCPKMNLDVSESLEKRIINIPSSAWL